MKDQTRAVIHSLEARNFGCLKNTALEFGSFTVLVGPNDSGKSMILKVFDTLSQLATASRVMSGDEFRELTSDLNGEPITIHLKGMSAGREFNYEISIELSGRTVGVQRERIEIGARDDDLGHIVVERNHQHISGEFTRKGQKISLGENNLEAHVPLLSNEGFQRFYGPGQRFQNYKDTEIPFGALLQAHEHARPFRLRPDRIGSSVTPSQKLSQRPMESDGWGAVKAVAELLLHQPEVIKRVQEALRDAMPHVNEVRIKPVQDPPVYALEIRTTSGARVPSRLVSDGVLIFLAYLLLVEGPEPTSILLFEEPEAHVHPGLLERIVTFMRERAHGRSAQVPVQVIATTQSPVLLNFVEPSEIRVVDRDAQRGTFVTPFESVPDLQKLLEYQGPGEIWLNLREDYLTKAARPS